jgi:predicted site-specific integrase-resolvase
MARTITKTNSPTPFNVNAAAHQIGCSPNTIRHYIKNGELEVQRTEGGHAILFDREIEQARKIYKRGLTRRGRARA